MRLIRSLLAVLVVGALSVTFTACGGDDGDSLSSLAGDGQDQADGNGGGGDIDLDDLPDPDELDDLADLAGVDEICVGSTYLAAGMLGAFTGETDPDATKFFEEYADQVPDEIRDDFGVIAEFWTDYTSMLAEYDNDITKLMADPEALAQMEAFDSPELESASDNVSAWFDENCDTNAN